MNVYALPAAMALAINATLCLVVFLNNPRGIVNRVFTSMILSFVAWNIGELIMVMSDHPSTAMLGLKIIFAGVFLFPVCFLHFSYVFPQQLSRYFDGWRSLLLYLGPVGLLIPFLLLLEVDIGRLIQIGNIFYYVFTFHGRLESYLLALLLSLIGLGYFIWGVVNFIISYRQSRIARQRLQILYLLVGIVSMFVIGLALHLINHFLHIGYSFFYVASLYSLLISFFFALAIVKYRLVDIHFIIRGGIVYSLFSGLVLVIYVLIIKNTCDIIARKLETESLLVEAVSVVILVFLLRPVERKVEEFIDRFFYRERYLFRLKFFEFTRRVLNLLDLPTLLQATEDFILQVLAVKKVGLWILDPGTRRFQIPHPSPPPESLSFAEDLPFILYLQNSRRALELEHLKDLSSSYPEMKWMLQEGFSLAVPLEWEEGMLAFLLVGEKQNRKGFSIMEIEALEALAPAMAMAISRARLFEDLKKKEQQMMQSEKLAALGEMAASFVHEIRNPLGIILGSVETLRKGVSPAVQSEMLQFISEESERINRMLTNFLDFAKPKPPAFQEVDVRRLLEKTIELISVAAQNRRVQIVQELPPTPIRLWIDPEQIREALVNLELNALEAMPLGGEMKLSVTPNGAQGVTIRVSDTGVGLPPGAESKIFDPFFTTKEKGTGLGLSIVYRVAKNHGGSVSAERNERGGTTFTLTIPHPKGMMGCFGPVGPPM
jgi:signal transduction histidine kinase